MTKKNAAFSLYWKDVSRYPVLTKDEELRLARLNTDEARHKLVLSNLRFVAKVAYRYQAYGFPLADLIQVGNVGLIVASKDYDASYNTSFVSYANWKIERRIREYVCRNYSLVRIGASPSERRLFSQLNAVKSALEHEFQTTYVTNEQLANYFKLSEAEIADMRARLGKDVSLTSLVKKESVEDDIADNNAASPELTLIEKQKKEVLHELLKKQKFTYREFVILQKRLLAQEPVPLLELGERLGVSRESVRQTEKKLLKKIKRLLEPMADEFK